MNIITKFTALLKGTLNLNDHIDTDAAERCIRSNIEFKGPNAWILAVAVICTGVEGDSLKKSVKYEEV